MSNNIKALRLSRAWSQEQLAELSSLSVRTIQRIENGGQASLETMSAIAAAFDLNVTDLYDDNEPDGEPEDALDTRILEAKRRVAREYRYYRSVLVWAIVCAGLAVINLLTSSHQYWFLWPTLIWGALLVTSGLRLFLLKGWLEKRQQQRLQQLLRK
ncbi:anaerobic benzoate catabolism transcriptional regulator [Cedecea lapagei]|uniref:Anaerobic benzoate catabolism transcriptional regulator n=1 Tax=Cedecea lapagei TaxID=158823 RepID=A0A3S5DPJ5_9ENTR|nr:2TM domain-containing protein [Cedecea lapagei]VEB95901.1 anaerobic benzoate catabolism transcriptional regulator [Cedecea lapagei]